jgi:hypothetical protein
MKWCNYTMQLRFPMGFMKLVQVGVEKSGALPLQQTAQLWLLFTESQFVGLMARYLYLFMHVVSYGSFWLHTGITYREIVLWPLLSVVTKRESSKCSWNGGLCITNPTINGSVSQSPNFLNCAGLERIIGYSISEWHSLWRPCAKGWRDGFSPCLCTFWARVVPLPWRWGSVISSSSIEKEIQSIEVDEALSGAHLSLCAYGQYQVVILCR